MQTRTFRLARVPGHPWHEKEDFLWGHEPVDPDTAQVEYQDLTLVRTGDREVIGIITDLWHDDGDTAYASITTVVMDSRVALREIYGHIPLAAEWVGGPLADPTQDQLRAVAATWRNRINLWAKGLQDDAPRTFVRTIMCEAYGEDLGGNAYVTCLAWIRRILHDIAETGTFVVDETRASLGFLLEWVGWHESHQHTTWLLVDQNLAPTLHDALHLAYVRHLMHLVNKVRDALSEEVAREYP